MFRSLSALTFAAFCALVLCIATPVAAATKSGKQGLQEQKIPTHGVSINAYRSGAGLSALRRSKRLDAAARAHATDMARRNFFDHRGSDGSTHTARIRRQGCGGGAENIAAGPYSSGSVMAAWMGSPGHKRNILLPAVTHYGLANVGDKWVLTLSRNCP